MALRCLSFRRMAWYLTPSLMHGSDRLIPVQCFQEVTDPAASSSCWVFSPAKPSPKGWWWHTRVHVTGGEKPAYLQMSSLLATGKWVKENARHWKTGPLPLSLLSQQWRESRGMEVNILLLDLALPQGLRLSWFELSISILPFVT